MNCPNCGQGFEGERCPNCGRPVNPKPNRTAAILVLVFVVLPCAAVGACSVAGVVQSAGQKSGDLSFLPVFIGVGLVALVALIGSIALCRNLWRG